MLISISKGVGLMMANALAENDDASKVYIIGRRKDISHRKRGGTCVDESVMLVDGGKLAAVIGEGCPSLFQVLVFLD